MPDGTPTRHAMPRPVTPAVTAGLMTSAELQRYLHISHAQMFRLMKRVPDPEKHEIPFPKPLRLGKRLLRWRMSEVEAWLQSKQ